MRRCCDRAQPKEVQTHLRHSTIAVTFDHYGHLFEQKMDDLAAGLDKTFRESRAHQSPTIGQDGHPVSDTEGGKWFVTCGNVLWARQGSNLRPMDYESVKGMAADLRLWMFGLVTGRFPVPVSCRPFDAVAGGMWPKCGLIGSGGGKGGH